MHHVSPPEKNKLVIEVNDHGTWCMVDNMVHIFGFYTWKRPLMGNPLFKMLSHFWLEFYDPSS